MSIFDQNHITIEQQSIKQSKLYEINFKFRIPTDKYYWLKLFAAQKLNGIQLSFEPIHSLTETWQKNVPLHIRNEAIFQEVFLITVSR